VNSIEGGVGPGKGARKNRVAQPSSDPKSRRDSHAQHGISTEGNITGHGEIEGQLSTDEKEKA